MFWYGWLVYCFLVGLAAGAVALLLPRRSEKFWAFVVWAVPLGCIAYMSWEARHWFTYNLAQ